MSLREHVTPTEFIDAYQEYTERSVELQDLLSIPNPHDLLTIPNLVSLSGLALVIKGSRQIDTIAGMNQIVVGRGLDLFDGFLARLLDQESDTGALVDAASDKVGMAFMVEAAWKKNAVPKEALSAIIASNALNASLSLIAAKRRPDISYRTPEEGKLAMAALNVGFITYGYANALEKEHPESHFHEPLNTIGKFAIDRGSELAVVAAGHYAVRAFAPK